MTLLAEGRELQQFVVNITVIALKMEDCCRLLFWWRFEWFNNWCWSTLPAFNWLYVNNNVSFFETTYWWCLLFWWRLNFWYTCIWFNYNYFILSPVYSFSVSLPPSVPVHCSIPWSHFSCQRLRNSTIPVFEICARIDLHRLIFKHT